MLASDIIIIILVFYGGYQGYQKGLISQFFVFMIFIIIIYKGIYVFDFVKKVNVVIVSKESYFFVIFSLIFSFFSIIFLAFLAKKIIEFIMMITWMKPVDRLFGGILGMIKYFFYISICLFFLKEANQKVDIIPYNFFQNSFEKEFQFLFSRKGYLFNKLKELYFYLQILFFK
ncbi:CvpA family protein [Blattabacterium cuenoti]|uniref:CvpA family protein n=1 Tax=Blattabacterium cuenoti TaxID=1653831 RepID=UPI00163C7405|nr:CvpA family protein [Blattabacterium cuenoti]